MPWRAGANKKCPDRFKAFIKQYAQSIYQQVVISKIMPMNNATGITDAERLLVKQWFEVGVKVE